MGIPETDGPQPPSQEDASADALARILFYLQQECAAHGGGLSLAKLSKRSGLRMSTLRRYLTALEQGGIVTLEIADTGVGRTALTAAGVAACAGLPAPEGDAGHDDADIS